MGFKEHNADFLEERFLTIHPALRISAANTGPGFSVAEIEAYLDLGREEEQMVKERKIVEPSNFISVLQNASVKCGRWKKWMKKEESLITEEDIAINKNRLKDVTLVCGRYVFDEKNVRPARKQLFNNFKKVSPLRNPEAEIIESIKKSIRPWIKAFNLKGTTSKILTKIRCL